MCYMIECTTFTGLSCSSYEFVNTLNGGFSPVYLFEEKTKMTKKTISITIDVDIDGESLPEILKVLLGEITGDDKPVKKKKGKDGAYV